MKTLQNLSLAGCTGLTNNLFHQLKGKLEVKGSAYIIIIPKIVYNIGDTAASFLPVLSVCVCTYT